MRCTTKRVALLLCAITVAPGVLAQQPGPAPQSGAAIPSTVTGALAQTLPARSGVPNPPPGSPEGLRLFLQNALAVARSGDHQKLAVLVKEMELPNYEAWFTSTF